MTTRYQAEPAARDFGIDDVLCTRLEVKGLDLILNHAEEGEIFVSETVERRLGTLGKALGLKGVVA